MSDYQMGTVEARFADLIWEKEPISSTELAKMSEASFWPCSSVPVWKKTS
mgnify:CR=1 FL=1